MTEELSARYLAKFDEISRLASEIAFESVSTDNGDAKNLERAQKEFEDILIDAYLEGFAFAAYMLGESSIEADTDEIAEAVYYTYQGEKDSVQAKFAAYYEDGDMESIKRLIESEFHRVHQTAGFQAAYKTDGAGKRWETMQDEKVRDTHSYIQGIEVPIQEDFVTFDGDRAKYPGGFSKAQNNANCRCALSYTRI